MTDEERRFKRLNRIKTQHHEFKVHSKEDIDWLISELNYCYRQKMSASKIEEIVIDFFSTLSSYKLFRFGPRIVAELLIEKIYQKGN